MTRTIPTPIKWIGDAKTGYLWLIDQTQLPGRTVELHCRDVESVWQAIRRLSVRGAPAIGIAAAYGCVIGAQAGEFTMAAEYLVTARPTAVNLEWAVNRLEALETDDPERLLEEAVKIHEEDAAMCEAIGRHALNLIKENTGVLTHCNAGALATGGIGTATAGMYLAHEAGTRFKVFADETRPLLQGSRLTAWELAHAGLDVTLICDSMAAQVMREKKIDLIITGADRIAANGDAANKIGTYNLAVLARHHNIPFYIAAPSSTFDRQCPSGDAIPIEQRDATELNGPPGANIYNPAFDVTPAELIAGIITERGIIEPVNAETVAAKLDGGDNVARQ